MLERALTLITRVDTSSHFTRNYCNESILFLKLINFFFIMSVSSLYLYWNLDSLYLNQPQTLCEQTYTSCTYYKISLSRATIGEGFSTGLEFTHSFLKDNRFLKIKISVNYYSNIALFREELESVVRFAGCFK